MISSSSRLDRADFLLPNERGLLLLFGGRYTATPGSIFALWRQHTSDNIVERLLLERSLISETLWHGHYPYSLIDEISRRREGLHSKKLDHAQFTLQVR